MPKEPKSYAPRIPLSAWEEHRCKIRALFVDQNKTLSSVAEIMRKYGLHASESQYERQLKAWGIRKNRTRDEWRLINRIVQKRRRQGKDSAVLINGVEQSKKKLDQELARSGYRDHGGQDHSLPEDVQVVSPTANTSMANRFPARSNSEEGTWSLWRQKLSQIVNGICAEIGKRFEGCSLWVQLQSEKHLRDRVLNGLDLSIQSRLFRIFERELHSPQSEPKLDEGRLLDSRLRDGSPSPSGLWRLPSLDSVGITSEEWVTRGWNVFFGTWAVG